MFKLNRHLFLLILLVGVFISFVNGQKPRSTPPTEVAEVVSRADDDFEKRSESVEDATNEKNKSNALDKKLEELSTRIKLLEAGKLGDYDDEQKKLLLSLDILTKTEQRAENLRKQLIEVIEKETNIKTRLETIEYNLRPEIISRSTAIYGSLRPEDIREQKKRNLESEKKNLENLLNQIQRNRQNLEISVKKADEWVEKVRLKFEKQIDKALEVNTENN